MSNTPRVWCDFNAIGWSGDPDDDAYYVFDAAALAQAEPTEGMRLFLFDWEDAEETRIVGCEAILERVGDAWRARPVYGSWCSGARLW